MGKEATYDPSEHLAKMGLPPFDVGEPLISVSVSVDYHNQRVERLLGPERPRRTYTPIVDWEPHGDGDESPVYGAEVTLTDEEFACATADYEKALEEFRRTHGVSFVPGPTETTATFETRTAKYEAVYDGKRWVVTRSTWLTPAPEGK
jgi:hypothetical protein